MHAKYEVSIHNGSKVLVNVKDDNKQTKRQDKTICPDHSIRGIKTILNDYIYIIIQMHQDIRLSNKLLEQVYVTERLKSPLQKF